MFWFLVMAVALAASPGIGVASGFIAPDSTLGSIGSSELRLTTSATPAGVANGDVFNRVWSMNARQLSYVCQDMAGVPCGCSITELSPGSKIVSCNVLSQELRASCTKSTLECTGTTPFGKATLACERESGLCNGTLGESAYRIDVNDASINNELSKVGA